MTHLRNQQINSNSDTPYYSQHDMAVVARMKEFAGTQGLGEEILYPDNDTLGLMQDFGLDSPNITRE
jgi:hypothetical protein